MRKALNRLREAMNKPPRIRAACLWGENLENRIDFDAAYWFAYYDEDIVTALFEETVRIHLPEEDFVQTFDNMHPEWGIVDLVTELPDEYPGIAEMFAWLASKGAAGCDPDKEDAPNALPITEFIEVYVSRKDALEWLRKNRPDLYADIKTTYSLPPPEQRFFP